MAKTRFVVEVTQPVPGERVGDVAARIAARFDMDVKRVRKLLDDRTGPVTKPLSKDKAERIARAFSDAGVAVEVEPEAARPATAAPPADAPFGEYRRTPPPPGRGDEEPPANVFLSSTRWVPSPHEEEVEVRALVEGQAAAVLSQPEAGADGEPSEPDPTWEPDAAPAPEPGSATVRPPRARRPGIRAYLLGAFVLALVALLALQAVNRAQRQDAAPATVEAGMRAYAGGDFAAARRVWLPLAQSGNARAQYMLGYMAENGQGRPWSNHDAAGWYRQAADHGYPQAQVALGQLYLRGMGVDRDPQHAAALFRASAQEGYGPGEFQYALALFHGTGVPQDFAEALTWFKAAAANGVAEARPYVSFAGSSAAEAGSGAGTQPSGQASPGQPAPSPSAPSQVAPGQPAQSQPTPPN